MARAMKDSGIEWIGKIPEEWEVKKIKYVSSITMGQSPNSDDYNIEGIGIPFLQGNADFTNRYPFEKIYCVNANKFSQPLDILFSVRAPVGAKNISDKVYAIGRGLCAITPKQINNNLMWYLIDIINCEFSFNARGSTYDSVTINDVNNSKIPIHSPTEQKAIADFLDKKCAVIDDTIEKQKLVIEKLHLYKQSLITEAITKGLHPNVKMKPSGIDWIGEMPINWEVSRVKYEFYNLDNRRQPISSENRCNGEHEYDYYGASGVIDKIDNYIFDETLILIGEDGANLLLRNLPLIYIAKGKYWVNNHAHVLKTKKHNSLFYMAYQLELVDLTVYISGSTQPKLTQENLSIIPIVIPPLHIQHAIIDYLDTKCVEIDSVIISKQKLINKLAEYKKSLIYECVTGKREVI